VALTQHWNFPEKLAQRDVLVNWKVIVMLLLDLVQLHSQYHFLVAVFVTFLHAHDWFVELTAHVNVVVVFVVVLT